MSNFYELNEQEWLEKQELDFDIELPDAGWYFTLNPVSISYAISAEDAKIRLQSDIVHFAEKSCKIENGNVSPIIRNSNASFLDDIYIYIFIQKGIVYLLPCNRFNDVGACLDNVGKFYYDRFYDVYKPEPYIFDELVTDKVYTINNNIMSIL